MQTALVVYSPPSEQQNHLFEELEERWSTRVLVHYASSLLERGLCREIELAQALQKAIHALNLASMPAYRHFRKVFVAMGNQLRTDWLVSDLGMRLLLLSSDTDNPVLAKMQIEILTEYDK